MILSISSGGINIIADENVEYETYAITYEELKQCVPFYSDLFDKKMEYILYEKKYKIKNTNTIGILVDKQYRDDRKENLYILETNDTNELVDVWESDFMEYNEIIFAAGLEYGILNGSNTILYIKVGNGGNIYGYNNKYIKIAKKVNKKNGCSVVVASNPLKVNEYDNFEKDINFIFNKFKDISEIFAFGHSNGGVVLSNNSCRCELIKKVLIVNAPLNINWHKIKNGLITSNASIACIYGKLDPSYRYIDLLKSISNIKVIELENIDHNFTQSSEIFENLIIDYMI